jgi:hypothetical protein
MNLREFTSGAGNPDSKPWLTIVAKSFEGKDIAATNIGATNIAASIIAATTINGTNIDASGSLSIGGVPVVPGNAISLGSAGGASLVSDGVGPVLEIKGLTAGSRVSLVDSGTDITISSDPVAGSALDQASPLAPAGQRDLWQYGDSTAGAGIQLRYDDSLGILWGGTTATVTYSTNGGGTFNPIVPDFAYNTLDVASKPGLVVGIPLDALSHAYTSADGINFAVGNIPPDYQWSFNTVYYSGANLFVTGVFNSGPTQRAMWSPDGLIWTLGVTPDINPYALASNSNIVVMVGHGAPYAMWSADGKAWTAATGLVADLSGVAWSEEQGVFLAFTSGGGAVYQSADGMAWTTAVATVPQPNGYFPLWVASGIDRWYLPAQNAQGNLSLMSSPDPDHPFVGTQLDGATLNAQPQANMVYIASLNRFVMSAATYGVAYSTARVDVKALTDNIRVRNAPVAVSQYSTSADVVLANDATETDISTAASLGSLFFQAPQPVGMTIESALQLVTTSVAGDTLTIRYKINGAAVLTHVLTIPALAVDLPVRLNGLFTVRTATLSISCAALVSAISNTIIVPAPPAYNPLIANTLSVTAQWGANVNSMTASQLVVGAYFRNGA